jgi:hypothetical protein
MVRKHVKRSRVLIERIDNSGRVDDATKAEILYLDNLASLCDKHELDWPVKGWRLNLLKVFMLLLKKLFTKGGREYAREACMPGRVHVDGGRSGYVQKSPTLAQGLIHRSSKEW